MAGAGNNDSYDFKSFLSTSYRDFVVRNNGDQVKIETLKGKKVGLYFSATWCRPCQKFTPTLVDAYSKLLPKGDFEIIFVSVDKSEKQFDDSFSKMPWLAIPFLDLQTRSCLAVLLSVTEIPYLVILDESGKISTNEGAKIILNFGEKGYPFTPEKFKALKENAINRFTVSCSRDLKVSGSNSKGNTSRGLGVPVFHNMKHKVNFEMVDMSHDEVVGQTLESILVAVGLDFVIGRDGSKVQVTSLVGKTVLLYFSAHWCPECRHFTPKLVEAYNQIRAKDHAFEVVFLSSDRAKTSFEEHYSEMPWLAIPFGDVRKYLVSSKFNVREIPMLITIGPTGETVTKETTNLIMAHGANAYPFTDERLKEIGAL